MYKDKKTGRVTKCCPPKCSRWCKMMKLLPIKWNSSIRAMGERMIQVSDPDKVQYWTHIGLVLFVNTRTHTCNGCSVRIRIFFLHVHYHLGKSITPLGLQSTHWNTTPSHLNSTDSSTCWSIKCYTFSLKLLSQHTLGIEQTRCFDAKKIFNRNRRLPMGRNQLCH